MSIRTLAICAAASLFMGGGFAIAQTGQKTPGDTSGPAAGSNVNPSSAVQKNRSSSSSNGSDQMNSSAAAGAPGVAGPKGSKNGPAENSPNH